MARNPRRKSLLDLEGYSKRVGKKLANKGVAVDDDTRTACVTAVFDVIRSTLLGKKRVHREILDLPGLFRIEILDVPEKVVRAPRATDTPYRAKGATRTCKVKLLTGPNGLKDAFDERYAKQPGKAMQRAADEKNGVEPEAEPKAEKTPKKKSSKKTNKSSKKSKK